MTKHLKKTRLVVASIVLLAITLYFIDIYSLIPESITKWSVKIQFIPLLLKTIGFSAISIVLLAIILLLTVLYGRIYCSAICPLGILQDIIIRIKKRFKPKWRFKFKKANNWLRYSILAVTAILLIIGVMGLVILLDPYSNFGRIVTDLVKPIIISVNNLFARILHKANIYWLTTVDYEIVLRGIIYPILFLGLLTGLTLWRGRFFCNSLCPVGGLLSLLSKYSVFKLKIGESSCTSCGKCMHNCKAECISIKDKTIDFSRCVACYNCIPVCESNSISYKLKTKPVTIDSKKPTEPKRRDMIAQTIGLGVGLIGINNLVYGSSDDNQQEYHKKLISKPVSPPGSVSIAYFNDKCTACHLCVAKCPSNVLQPSLFEYGLTNMFQPKMDYSVSYCGFDCTVCGEVCPTGAILPITKNEKHTCQIGHVKFFKGQCVVKTDETACGSCSEHCPTQAVYMVPYKDSLTIPEVKPELCIGCGGCEYACPVEPQKAIVVVAESVHQVAKRPETKEIEFDPDADFPF